MYRARDAASGALLAERLRPAHTHWTRLKGLLGTRSLDAGDGLWLKPCRQVHMFGMRYAIDVVFLDDARFVLSVVHALQPGKVSPQVADAGSVLELPAGTLARSGLTVGARVDIEGAPAAQANGTSSRRRWWLRGGIWVLGFIVMTSCLVLVMRGKYPWREMCPEYLQFWAAGKLLAAGESPYDLSRLGEIEKANGWNKATAGLGIYDVMPHNYPPSLLSLILVLLVPLGFSTARVTWLAINAEFMVIVGYMLRNAVVGVSPAVPMLLLPFFGLSILSVLVGQVTALPLVLLAAAWRLLQRGWDRSAGCVLACLSMKPQVTTLVVVATLVWLARQHRWRAVAAFAFVSALSLLVGLWWVPSWPWQLAHNLTHVPFAMGTDRYPWWGTTWLLVLRSLGVEGVLLWMLYVAVAAPACWLVLRRALQPMATIDDVLAVSILATFFVTPTARIYDLPLLLVAVLVLMGKRLPGLVGGALLVVLMLAPSIQLIFLVGVKDHIPTHVSFFWIPVLLALLWILQAWKSAPAPPAATHPPSW